MRILITGGSGFIGTNLISSLISDGHIVSNIDNRVPRNPNYSSTWSKSDIRDKISLRKNIFQFKPEFLIHLAARTDLDGTSIDDYDSNTLGIQNIIDVCLTCPSIERIIFSSTRLVCKIGYLPSSDNDYTPSTIYGESKVLGEKVIKTSARKARWTWCIVRPTSIWGPWFDIPYRTFFDSVISGRYIHPKGVRIVKSFGYVGNTTFQLDKLLKAPDKLVDRKTFYLADYTPIEVLSMANQIRNQLNLSSIKEIPIPMLKILAKFGDLAKYAGIQKPPLTTYRFNNLLTPMVHNLNELEEIVGPLPFDIESGIAHTLEWIRNSTDTK